MRYLVLALSFALLGIGSAWADTPPKPVGLHQCSNYPLDALADGNSGNTTVSFQISTEGVPTDLHIDAKSGDDRLDEAALRCVAGWRYEQPTLEHAIAMPWKAIVTWRIDIAMPMAAKDSRHDCQSIPGTQTALTGIVGPAVLDFIIDTDGSVHNPTVYVSSGNTALDAAVRECVTGWKYLAATNNGEPIAVLWGARIGLTSAGVQLTENVLKPHYCSYRDPGASHAEGTAVVSFTVDKNGRTKEPAVTQTSGNKYLDQTALHCATLWKYKPATEHGEPVEAKWSVQVMWRSDYAFVLERGLGG